MSSADSHAAHSINSERTARTKQKWSLTPDAFEKLLNSFSPDRDEAGVQYEIIRRKLVRFFEWRALDSPNDYADETINRVARRIAEGQIVDNLKSYFYGVARLVFLEAKKDPNLAEVPLDDTPRVIESKDPDAPESEMRIQCFDHCLDSLPSENRKLIVDYYREERRTKIQLRQELASTLQIPLNALRIRAHRIRVSLEQCIRHCMKSQ